MIFRAACDGVISKVNCFMIMLTRCNGTSIMLNESFIELAEETPDTVVTMLNGHRYIVKERVSEIIEMSAAFRRQCAAEYENTGERSPENAD